MMIQVDNFLLKSVFCISSQETTDRSFLEKSKTFRSNKNLSETPQNTKSQPFHESLSASTSQPHTPTTVQTSLTQHPNHDLGSFQEGIKEKKLELPYKRTFNHQQKTTHQPPYKLP